MDLPPALFVHASPTDLNRKHQIKINVWTTLDKINTSHHLP
jgi:hypothetical protein